MESVTLSRTQQRVLHVLEHPGRPSDVHQITYMVNTDGGKEMTVESVSQALAALAKLELVQRIRRGFYKLASKPEQRVARAGIKSRYYVVTIDKEAATGREMFKALKSPPFDNLSDAESLVSDTLAQIGDTSITLGIINLVAQYEKKKVVTYKVEVN